MIKTTVLDIRRYRQMFKYNYKTGAVTLRINRGKFKAGDSALRKNRRSRYLVVCVDGYTVSAGRFVWALYFGRMPEGFVVFKNGDVTDLRIHNLVDSPTRPTRGACAARRSNQGDSIRVALTTR